MRQKQLIWLVAVLAVLILVAYLAGVFDSDVSTVDMPEVDLPADQITRIDIRTPEDELHLEKSPAWTLSGPAAGRADSNTVADFLEDLSSLELVTVVSRNPDRYERYGVDSTGTTVTVSWDGGEKTFVVGERGSDYASNYVRLEGDERVFLTRKAINVPAEHDRWRDRTIVNVAPEEIRGASVTGPDREYSLSSVGGRWTIGGEAADSSSVMRWLDRFSPMNADGFLTAAGGPSDSTYVVELQTGTDGARRIQFSPRDGDFAVTIDGDATVYRLRGVRLDQFVPDATLFRGE